MSELIPDLCLFVEKTENSWQGDQMELGGLDIQILRAITNRKRRVAVEFAGAEFILSGPAVRRELGKDSDIDILGILP